MKEENYILNTQLPLSQDFYALKEQGLAYIQQHSDYQWTNLNPSDPGVTILDQLCYAFTELGYCNDFSIPDILAKKDGTIRIEDEFYLPEVILTTAPVTRKDYIKYLVDGVDNVNNAVLLRSKDTIIASIYKIRLMIDASVTGADAGYVCAAAFVYLNKSRNLSEMFGMPAPLAAVPVSLSGTIEIENEDRLADILQQIDSAISNYIFPVVTAKSYTEPVTDESIDIFNGPRLDNGWISDNMLGKKKDAITIYEIIQLIGNIPGVVSIAQLNFSGQDNSAVECKHSELIAINATTSYSAKSLVFTCNGTTIDTGASASTSTAQNDSFETSILFGSGTDIRDDLPKANYRDINSYYSVQNTFPEIYAVGPDSVQSSAPAFQVAQSRQLKGYLTLFDQVLANQFSQLANIDRLFSFRNSMTPAPSDTQWYYEVKDEQQKKNPVYPVPYLRFAPTYYFQSLYTIPDIKPLLKDNDTFQFSLAPLPANVMEKKDWLRFRLDPYNPYIRGLMTIMEEETASLHRRNEMLDHLLARHGESPMMINAYIDGSFYTRERIRDKVIFKSLYLQNLGLLSYNRYKAYNYLEADRIIRLLHTETEENPFPVPETYEKFEKKTAVELVLDELKERIFTDLDPVENAKLEKLVKRNDSPAALFLEKWILEGNSIDSIFDAGKVDVLEKLTENDFRNYSGIELKLNLLFGLKVLYRDLLTGGSQIVFSPGGPVYSPCTTQEKLQALWMMLERKGLILLEMPLLLCALQFRIIIANSTSNGITIWQMAEQTDYETTLQLAGTLRSMNSTALDNATKDGQISMNEKSYPLQPPQSIAELTAGYRQIPGTAYYYQVNAVEANKASFACTDFFTQLVFLFPQYVPAFSSAEFIQRINFFLGNELPVNMAYSLKYADAELLEKIIPAFIRWHDSMTAIKMNNYSIARSAPAAFNLLSEINNAKPFPEA